MTLLDNMEQGRAERITMETPEQFINIFGIREENIPIFREELGVGL